MLCPRDLPEHFRGEQRLGLPVSFTEYYPKNTPDVPLYAYLANSYQRALAGNSPEIPVDDMVSYEALCGKADRGKLSSREAERLHALQAEVDGRDYWMLYKGVRSIPVVEEHTLDEFDLRLLRLSDRAASAAIKRSRK